MLPEGLQYQSIADTVSKIKSLGMNVIRLTYAIEMIDDIYSENPNSTLKGTLVNALGSENGSAVLAQILSKNPQFTESTTRLEVLWITICKRMSLTQTRLSMLSPPSVPSRKSMFTLTTTCHQQPGVALPLMVMAGSGTRTLTSTIGSEALHTWPTTQSHGQLTSLRLCGTSCVIPEAIRLLRPTDGQTGIPI